MVTAEATQYAKLINMKMKDVNLTYTSGFLTISRRNNPAFLVWAFMACEELVTPGFLESGTTGGHDQSYSNNSQVTNMELFEEPQQYLQ